MALTVVVAEKPTCVACWLLFAIVFPSCQPLLADSHPRNTATAGTWNDVTVKRKKDGVRYQVFPRGVYCPSLTLGHGQELGEESEA
ncbi:hypothetical protein B0T16DRAFT_398725 [Cercophora newfieldiana]|uniref:Secreted protein n=1 Tax=Cercophora newfieldiana TaxID=92897 RepID=A0AA39YRN7_9PEZI|nr:hypothetical protein B0T16DRAFT_398725 [Cercophora newfieldiana]